MSEENEALKEGARAVAEVAKTTGKAVDAVRSAGGWLDKIFAAGTEHAVARRWSDRELVRRIEAAILDWERLELLMHKVQRNLWAAGITHTRTPPPKIILPLLEKATMEHEDDLHTMYANLLTAAINPSAEEIGKKYVSVLSEFSAADIHTLRAMFAEWQYWKKERSKRSNGKDRYSSGIVGFPGNDDTSVILAYRLGLILPVNVEVNEYHPEERDLYGNSYSARAEKVVVSGDLAAVSFTEFGERFCEAVMGDLSGEYTPPEKVGRGARRG